MNLTGDEYICYWDPDLNVWVFRSSAMNQCTLEFLAAKRGIQPSSPPENIQRAFDEGHENEQLILDAVSKEYGLTLRDYQKRVDIPIIPGAIIRGHIDAMCDEGVVDAKAFAESTYKAWEKDWRGTYEKFGYLNQMANYSFGNRDADGNWPDIGMAIGRKERDKATGKVKIKEVVAVTYTAEELELKRHMTKNRMKVMEVMNWDESKDLPECADLKRYPCRYYFLRGMGQTVIPDVIDPPEDMTSNVYDMVTKLEEAKRNVKYWQAIADELQPRLMDLYNNLAGSKANEEDAKLRPKLRSGKWIVVKRWNNRDVVEWDRLKDELGVVKEQWVKKVPTGSWLEIKSNVAAESLLSNPIATKEQSGQSQPTTERSQPTRTTQRSFADMQDEAIIGVKELDWED